MAVYYNEIDPFAAAWLRELIKAGHIAKGEVDGRPIKEVKSDELRGFAQCHFFAGIGVWSYALRAAGWADDTPVFTGSCPCQSFSASGKRGGFSDQRHLWPAWFRLIRELHPDTIFGVQVAYKDGLAWLDVVSADLEGAGYAIGTADLCAAGFGAPHIRQRLYFVAESAGVRFESLREIRRSNEQGNGWEGDSRAQRRSTSEPSREGEAGCMADAELYGQPTKRESGGAQDERRLHQPEGRGSAGDLGDTAQRGLGMRGSTSGERGRAAQPEQTNELDITNVEGLEGRQSEDAGQGTESAGRCKITGRGFTNGFWADAEWIWCRDQKYRPVEPGTFPLVTGATNRVGRLRGYGNSLTAPVAEEFIRAYMELNR